LNQVGTVSSGIVSYNTEISFDTQDDRVKSGMSVSVSIITNTHENVLIVPNSAIKTQGNLTFVESFIPALTVLKGVTGTPSEIPPQRKKVEIGLVDDTYTEIISGLNEGDQIVTRTVTGSVSATKTTNASSILSGNRSGATGGVRIPRNYI
jgi:HlyD family secretion protein